jgi:hypothetical protein
MAGLMGREYGGRLIVIYQDFFHDTSKGKDHAVFIVSGYGDDVTYLHAIGKDCASGSALE